MEPLPKIKIGQEENAFCSEQDSRPPLPPQHKQTQNGIAGPDQAEDREDQQLGCDTGLLEDQEPDQRYQGQTKQRRANSRLQKARELVEGALGGPTVRVGQVWWRHGTR